MVTAAIVVIGLLITVTIPLSFPPDGGPTAVDRAIGDRVHEGLDTHPGLYHALVVPSNAYVVLPILLLGVLYCLYRRDWWGAGFLVVIPELVVALNTWVLKPLWDRQLDDYLAYPSGHTVQFTAIVTGVLLVVADARTRIVIGAVAAAALVAFAVGMVGLGYHYPSDIAGGATVALAAALGCWAALTPVRRRTERGAPGEPFDPAAHPPAAVTPTSGGVALPGTESVPSVAPAGNSVRADAAQPASDAVARDQPGP